MLFMCGLIHTEKPTEVQHNMNTNVKCQFELNEQMVKNLKKIAQVKLNTIISTQKGLCSTG